MGKTQYVYAYIYCIYIYTYIYIYIYHIYIHMHLVSTIWTWLFFRCPRNEFLDIHPLAVGELLSLHLVAVLSGPLRAFYHPWIPGWSDFWHLPWTFTWILVLLPATCSFLHSCSLAFSISTIYLVLSDFW